MRSTRVRRGDDQTLPFAVPEPASGDSRRGRRRGGGQGEVRHRLGSNALASRGLPAGTELLVDTERPPRRGQVLFVRVGGRLKVGVFEVEVGRAVLRSDVESLWLDHTVEVWGVATVADAPLDGMPR